jgi:hypothetical protein
MVRGQGRRWSPAVVVVTLSLVGAACGGPSALTRVPPPAHGRPGPSPVTAIVGVAWPCVGAGSGAALARIPVDVVLASPAKVISHEVVPGGTTYRFTTEPGTYVVSSNAPYQRPVTVTVRAGQVIHADLAPPCK